MNAAASTLGMHRALASGSRARILELLRESPDPLSVAEVAAGLGVKPVTARFHLELLLGAGLIESEPERRSTPGRPSMLYSVRSETPPEPAATDHLEADDYERLASILAAQLAESPDPSTAAFEAGRRWTQALEVAEPTASGDPIHAVTDLMSRLGFAPNREAGSNEIALLRCPFESVAREHREVVCAVHAGMIEETLSRLGRKARMTSFKPFVTDHPLLCTVTIEP